MLLYILLSFLAFIALFSGIEKLFNIAIPDRVEALIVSSLSLIASALLTSKTAVDYIHINGEKKITDDSHSLFFIPMKCWPYILYVLAVVIAVATLLGY